MEGGGGLHNLTGLDKKTVDLAVELHLQGDNEDRVRKEKAAAEEVKPSSSPSPS
jgi:hypothetical protein